MIDYRYLFIFQLIETLKIILRDNEGTGENPIIV